MSRSSFKGPFFNINVKNTIKKNNNEVIMIENINKIYSIYNGKKFIRLKISEKMIGFRFGEFINTRIRHIYNKKK